MFVKEENECIIVILLILNGEFLVDKFVFMVIVSGVVKKVVLDVFSNVCVNGFIVLILCDGDEFIGVDIINGESEIMLFFV